ncbi:hypothetical protein D3C71_1616970 [compost metagenome]
MITSQFSQTCQSATASIPINEMIRPIGVMANAFHSMGTTTLARFSKNPPIGDRICHRP